MVRVTRQIVAKARALMRTGLSMHEAAIRLDVMATDLDTSLWAFIDIDDDTLSYEVKRPTPMF